MAKKLPNIPPYFKKIYSPESLADPAQLRMIFKQDAAKGHIRFATMIERVGRLHPLYDPNNPSLRTINRNKQRARKALDPATIDTLFNQMISKLG